MKIIDPGHLYELDTLGRVDGWADEFKQLRFVKRIGERYPGNRAPGYEGTTSQEVIRALIDRARYVDKQKPHSHNYAVIRLPRTALRELEMRAAEERDDGSAVTVIFKLKEPELASTCDTCGHIRCSKHGESSTETT